MKKIAFIILLFCAIILPSTAQADEVSYEESWQFMYAFPLTWQNNQLTQARPYEITTGDATPLIAGAWTLTMLDGNRQPLAAYRFDPAGMASGGVFDLIVAKESRGAYARFSDAVGRIAFEVSVLGSRICDDDGVCYAAAGERVENCPTDCGRQVAVVSDAMSAAIAPQLSLGAKAGSLLMRLSLGAIGLMLLAITGRMLDNRRAP